MTEDELTEQEKRERAEAEEKAAASVADDEPTDEELLAEATKFLESKGKKVVDPSDIKQEAPAIEKKKLNPWDEGYGDQLKAELAEELNRKQETADKLVAQIKAKRPDLPQEQIDSFRQQLQRSEYTADKLEDMVKNGTANTLADAAWARHLDANPTTQSTLERPRNPRDRNAPTPRNDPDQYLPTSIKQEIDRMQAKVVDPKYRLTDDEVREALSL